MPFPATTWGRLLEPGARQEAEQFAALLQGFLSEQHKDTGAHSAITADSIDVTGDVTVGEDVIVSGEVVVGNVTVNQEEIIVTPTPSATASVATGA